LQTDKVGSRLVDGADALQLIALRNTLECAGTVGRSRIGSDEKNFNFLL
jgi:hypothetical protein